ncbi:MAG: phosphoribosylanthranilate isomerase [Acidobacteria bacterium]|nr:phosphoribosylanthranilate isomerase [Acidobacteriota bacterium]
MTKVKICGITNLDDALHAVQCGADMLGFNFYPGSKRYIEPATAARITAALTGTGVLLAGVFVNSEAAEIAEIVNDLGLHVVQLHGNEPPEFVQLLRELVPAVEIIKALRVGRDFSPKDLDRHPADRILVDGDAGSEFGGGGRVFDWSVIAGFEHLVLAGGLTPDNVADAIRTIGPYAVDVASGVESWPGKKDPAKVDAFIRAAREAI